MGLAWVFEQFENALTESTLGLKLPDRIDPANADPAHLAHRGIAVQIPSTDNTGLYRDDSFALASDRVEVALTYRVRPQEQRASRREAITLEEQIREVLVSESWQRDLHVSYVGTSQRGPHPNSSEWFLITQVFATRRDAQLGGM
jgi:hypothetical protein